MLPLDVQASLMNSTTLIEDDLSSQEQADLRCAIKHLARHFGLTTKRVRTIVEAALRYERVLCDKYTGAHYNALLLDIALRLRRDDAGRGLRA